MSKLTILTLISLTLSCLIFFRKKDPSTIAAGEGLIVKKEWLKINQNPITPTSDLRPPDQTFLTFPEWYLVFSPEEQATYLASHTSTGFPFTTNMAQLWESYRIVNNQIKEDFPINTGYHFMIWVIATSSSLEYCAKAGYETLIGRLTDPHEVVTEEDKFNAKFARDYVDFINDIPWYEFDFKSQLGDLWTTSFWGDHWIRKMERKYILTSELLVKWVYGILIGMGTATVYEAAMPTTVVLIDKLPEGFPVDDIINTFDNQSALVKLPRYDQFKDAATQLANDGVSFIEIAGNNGAILLSVLLPIEQKLNYPDTQIIFTQPIASNPAQKRIALVTTVPNLHILLQQLSIQGVQVEHVFDY